MMSEKQNSLNQAQLIDQAAYLEDELAALKTVISAVPYDEKPPGLPSIKEMLMEIRRAQESYYAPLIKGIFSDAQPEFNDLQDIQKSHNDTHASVVDPLEVIEETMVSRAKLMDILRKIPLNDWDRIGTVNGQELTMRDVLSEMIKFERGKFKEIAERVLVIDASRSSIKPPKT